MTDKVGFDEFVVSRSPALLRTAYLLGINALRASESIIESGPWG